MSDFWKVCDNEYNTHTEGLSFEEAIELANELTELFEEVYTAQPNPNYQEPRVAHVYNTRGVVDGWEDLFNY